MIQNNDPVPEMPNDQPLTGTVKGNEADLAYLDEPVAPPPIEQKSQQSEKYGFLRPLRLPCKKMTLLNAPIVTKSFPLQAMFLPVGRKKMFRQERLTPGKSPSLPIVISNRYRAKAKAILIKLSFLEMKSN